MEYYVHTQYSPWHRLRVQLAGGLLAALLPYLLRLTMVWNDPARLIGNSNSIPVLNSSFVLSFACIFAGTVIMRSMTRYPGVEGSASILPAFSVTFGVMLLVLVMGRIEYTRSVLLGSYALAVLWFYIVHFKEQHRPLRVGVTEHALLDPGLLKSRRVVPVALDRPEVAPGAIDIIAVDLRVDLSPDWERWLASQALAGTQVLHIKHLNESLSGQVALEHLSETSYGTLSPSSIYLLIKQTIDWFLALVALVALAPILLVIAATIRLDSSGPAIFRQRRVGYRGIPFTVYKFRTMAKATVGTEQRIAAMTQDNDVRITRFGKFLRQSRIDEIPQLFNVLKGEMSWIGPRPEAEVLSQWYEKEIPFYQYRHIVRPGITGWAQVCQGHVADLQQVIGKLHYDFYYIKNFSPWIDMLIVVRTIKTMLTGFGAR